jgi:FkbM family methyltransferase
METMKELLRTNDPVRLSWLTALLTEQDIEAIVFDTHTSILEGSVSAIPRRLMVIDDDFNAACEVLVAAGELEESEPEPDRLLGGRVRLRQPEAGYRVAIAPVLLAAATPAVAGRVLDVGAGVGAAALCYAVRVPGAQVTGLEVQPELAAIATENIARNDLSDRVRIVVGDLLRAPDMLEPGTFDHVMANPPFMPADRGLTPPDRSKAVATVEGAADLAAWIDFGLRMVKPKGSITLVHRADRLDEVLTLLGAWAGGPVGGIVVFPLWPGHGRPAKRVIVRARPGVRAPMRLAAGLTLHREDGEYDDAALAVLRDGEALAL